MKKIIAILLALTLVSALAACGPSNGTAPTSPSDPAQSPDSSAAQNNQEGHEAVNEALTSSGAVDLLSLEVDASRSSTANSDQRYPKIVVPNEEVPDLLPYNTLGGPKAAICVEIYETLFDSVGDELKPHLASGYTEIDDTHVEVKLFDGIHDWEGNEITADDVVFSYNLTVNSGYANDFNYYEKVEATDPHTLLFTWKEPITSLTSLSSMLAKVCIVSEKAYGDHDFTTDPIGTGPYTLESFDVGVSVILKANDNYWQTDDSQRSYLALSNVDEIEFDVITDSSMQAIALENGAVDFCDIRSMNVDSFIESGNYLVGTLPNPFMVSLILNQSSESLCQDENLRLAIYYALDNEAMTQGLGAYAFYPLKAFASPVYSDYQASWSTAENYNTVYDPDLAKEYLKNSNYSGETLEILCSGLETNQQAAVIIQNFLLDIGIKTNITSYDQSMIFSIASDETKWDLLIDAGRSGSGLCISRIVSEFVATEIPYGKVKCFIDDPTLTDMLVTCNSKDGYSVELTNQIMEYLVDHVLAYGMYGNTGVYALNPDFASVALYNNNSSFVYGSSNYYLD